ncbi:MAG TPA: DNA polymerase III subunit gamma/tau [Alphaproteobacteria bacterium]|nr:DNA polymerase III subunit gamma/tau [Alphaproteobacteria bacterium]
MTNSPAAAPYRVLARKYRPQSFADLIGQEAMVRTLSNAIATGRIAHAFVLTGVRGIGKTTTARIIARALNCIGPDGKGGPTIAPCGVCEHCVGIAEDRHMDVVEMDAASHNGVDDIRDLTDGARYRPVKARFKVYILDEVHMLSKPAFNALLKTLEEPPEHVKFIFATTEIRKVPITVLSRCQRFDLRRIDQAVLAKFLASIAGKEGRNVEPAAAALLARAADGSARDGLSLLDRALAHVEGTVGEADTRALLGLADRTQVFDLFESTMKGSTAQALTQLGEAYRAGADPAIVVQDLLDVTHWLTRLKVAPDLAEDPTVPEAERARGKTLAAGLPMAVLARTWQMLLKGLAEIQAASSPLAAAEMLLVRLAYAAELPTPAELVSGLAAAPAPAAGKPVGNGGASARPAATSAVSTTNLRGAPGGSQAQALRSDTAPVAEAAPAPAPERPEPQSFLDVVALFEAKREALIHAHLVSHVHLVKFEVGRIEYNPEPQAPRNLPARMMELLQSWTGRRWVVVINAAADGAPTLTQQAHRAREAQKEAAAAHPLVDEVLKAFPGATIETVRGMAAPSSEAGAGDDESELSTDDAEEPS